MTNIENSKKILNQLIDFGVSDFVICPGGRCAPLIAAIENIDGINTHHFFDERSASFFALGLGKKDNKPAVVVTTSGTAVSECLSAFIEAHYSATPLIILSADRPKSYRGSGAPQAISQAKIFSNYATYAYDLENQFELEALHGQVHINICFDEPLLDESIKSLAEPRLKSDTKNLLDHPLIIVGALSHADRLEVSHFLKKNNLICYLESASNLKHDKDLNQLEIHSGQLTIDYVESNFTGIIRVGSVPTLRLWRDLEKSFLPVVSFSKSKFSGLPRIKEEAQPIKGLADLESENKINSCSQFLSTSYNYDDYLLSEPSIIHYLSAVIPDDAILFLGNSMVLRNWDDYAKSHSSQKIYVNRGANGIDGLISTAIGCAEEGRELWVVVGDQSALYDMQALWACQGLKNIKVRVVVINNGGGKIFSKVFKSKSILKNLENNHQLSFKPWAEMFNFDYYNVSSADQFKGYTEAAVVIECSVNNNETSKFIESLNV